VADLLTDRSLAPLWGAGTALSPSTCCAVWKSAIRLCLLCTGVRRYTFRRVVCG